MQIFGKASSDHVPQRTNEQGRGRKTQRDARDSSTHLFAVLCERLVPVDHPEISRQRATRRLLSAMPSGNDTKLRRM